MKKLNIEFQELPYAVEEAMNRLRINIKFCGKNTRKILITSSMPNEGKSSVAINLWKMLAEAGFPAVLVDVDLRKSVIKDRHHIKDADKLPDLGYFLSGQSEMEDVIYETQVENAYIVTTSYITMHRRRLVPQTVGKLTIPAVTVITPPIRRFRQ